MNEKNDKSTTYPVYRKYKGINVWFKVVDARNFIEIKQLGTKFIRHEVSAVQYPEMLRIEDMVQCLDGRWEPIEEAVYLQIVNDHFTT